MPLLPELAEPIVIVSDVHLSARSNWASKLDRIRGLWQKAGTVVFNGDTLNLGLANRKEMCRQAIECIGQICQADGVRAVVLAGNADSILDGPRHLLLKGGRLLVLHGDVLFDSISPWRRSAKKLRAARDESLRKMPPRMRASIEGQQASVTEAIRIVHDRSGKRIRSRRRTFLENLVSLSWPRQILSILRAWRDAPGLAVNFMETYSPQANCLVMGHIHRSGIWHIGDRSVISTEGFEGPRKPGVAYVEGDSVTLRIARQTGASYQPGKVIGRVAL